jgi:hypothetical protein
MSQKIYSLYKPFRNRLVNDYNLIDGLYVIWAFSRNNLFNYSFPPDIELPNNFDPNGDFYKRYKGGIPEFQLEFLMKQILINCPDFSTKKSFLKSAELAKVVNYLRKELYEKIEEEVMISEDDVFIEFNRKAHTQFKEQVSYSPATILRYYKIYSDKTLNSLIESKLQLTVHELFIIGFIFFDSTAKFFRNQLPIPHKIPKISDENINTFISNFSISIEAAKEELKRYQQVNENLFYTFNPLLAKPIIVYKNSYLCPIPLMVYYLITEGIYYNIVDNKGVFSEAYGNSFQNYIGEVLYKICSEKLSIFPEEKYYSPEEKRTTDWILEDENSIMFIECKTLRLTLISKTNMDMNTPKGLNEDLVEMAKQITKIYVTYLDYVDNKYPQIKYKQNKIFFPSIVILEEWYLFANPMLDMKLKELIIIEMAKKSVDISLLEKYPYVMFSSKNFETDIQLINLLGISTYFEKFFKVELNEIRDNTKFNHVFENEFIETFLNPLRQ